MPGFYDDYKREKQKSQPTVIKRSLGTAVFEFVTKLFTAVFYLCAILLSSVGLTTLINRPLRDMLYELIKNIFF